MEGMMMMMMTVGLVGMMGMMRILIRMGVITMVGTVFLAIMTIVGMLRVNSIIPIVIPVRKGSIQIFVVPTLPWSLFNHSERKAMTINILVFIVTIHTNIRFGFFFIAVVVVIVVVVGDDDRFIYGSIVIISHNDSDCSSGSFGLENRIGTNIVVRAGSECIFPAPFFLDSLQIPH